MPNVGTQLQKPRFSVAISTPAYQKMINNTLRDPKRAQRFIASITSAVATNPALQECDPATILAGALLGESLNLSPSPQLGQYYLVPFWNSKKGCNDATFVIGYKGLIQMALRTGKYKRLNVISVKTGELKHFDRLTEEVQIEFIEDDAEREAAPTVGYLAMFEYLNGYRKTLYWSRERMEAHAMQYSKGYSAKKGYTMWEKNFDSMAYKTMLRQLISKWGETSTEMQQALEADKSEPPDNDYIQAEEMPQAPQALPERPQMVEPAVDDDTGEVLNLDDIN